MAGLYIHIPICKSRCYYCDFYSSTYHGNKGELLSAMKKELESRADYLNGECVQTIYLGGGTPSLLSVIELNDLFETVFKYYNCDVKEITLEGNPEDLTPSYLVALKKLPISRLSIGIQSFNDNELKSINRRHSSEVALQCVKNAQETGFHNISIDLIYGLPQQSLSDWNKNLIQAIELNVPHISAYSLTFEERSLLTKKLQKGEIEETDEEIYLNMFRVLREKLSSAGILPYEISNFARPGFESQHNSAYWDAIPYIGIGPSAHSFNGTSRQWNIANSRQYIENIHHGKCYFEIEELDLNTRFNEFVMTSLRKCEGINLTSVQKQFGTNYLSHLSREAKKFVQNGMLKQDKNQMWLTEEGIFISDYIIEELFLV
jgi:oxygen-independent coproporphyrinogen-3 oxidase